MAGRLGESRLLSERHTASPVRGHGISICDAVRPCVRGALRVIVRVIVANCLVLMVEWRQARLRAFTYLGIPWVGIIDIILGRIVIGFRVLKWMSKLHSLSSPCLTRH